MTYSIVTSDAAVPLVTEFDTELSSIAEWWIANVIVPSGGGFVGEIDAHNRPRFEANKGGILCGRLLWFFSAAGSYTGRERYRQVAGSVYDYLATRFWDPVHAGVYWEVDSNGAPASDRKHVYAQAFAIYGLCAYYGLTGDAAALSRAFRLYEILESVAHDPVNEGYIEAFNRDWTAADDSRLSLEEPNTPRSMNAHLHILEAYTALHRVAAGPGIRSSLERLVGYFMKYFITDDFHLRMFFDSNWRDISTGYSYGHDMEFSWLLCEALEELGDDALSSALQPVSLKMADNCLRKGMAENGQLLDGYDLKAGKPLASAPWWVQAEALVGFMNAYSMTGDIQYFKAFEKAWVFIKNYQKDREKGEWHWLATPDQAEGYSLCKAGFWKCPYHNGRAMMEVCRRLRGLGDGRAR